MEPAGVPEFVWWLVGFLVLAVTIGAALWLFSLRPEVAVWKQHYQAIAEEEGRTRRDLINLARLLPKEIGEPYTSLCRRGKVEADGGLKALESVRRKLVGVKPEGIPLLPSWALWLVLPIFYELGRRLWSAWQLEQADRQLRRAERAAQAVQVVLNEVPRQGREVVRRVGQTRDVAVELRQQADGFNAAGALTEAVGKLSEAIGELEQADALLRVRDDPDVVVKAYALHQQAEAKVGGAEEALKLLVKKRQKFLPRLEQARQMLLDMDERLKEEETHYACPTLRPEWLGLDQLQARIHTEFEAGRFDAVEPGLTDLLKMGKDWLARLNRLQQERERLERLYAETDEALAALRDWLRDLPSTYQMDTSLGLVQVLEGQLQRVMQTLRSDQMEDYRRFEAFKPDQVQQTQSEFRRRLERYHALVADVHATRVQSVQQRAERVLQALGARHERYRTRGDWKGLQEALSGLQTVLAAAQAGGMVVIESRLGDVVQTWQRAQEALQTLERRCDAAEKVQALVLMELQRAQKALGDAAFGQCGRVAADGLPEQKAQAQEITRQVARLREQFAKQGEDFGALATVAEKLRGDAQRLGTMYQAELRKNEGLLIDLQEKLRSLRVELDQLRRHEYLDFSAVGEMDERIERWLGEAGRVQRDGLHSMLGVVQAGTTLLKGVQVMRSERLTEGNRVAERLRETGEALGRAEQVLQEARAARQGATWLQGSLAEMDPFMADEQILHGAREALVRVQRPFRKRLAVEALDELGRVQTQAQTVEQHAKQVLGEIRRQAQQVNASEKKPLV